MMTPTRVLSSHLQNTPAASFPKFAPAGSATLACYFSPMLDGLIPTLPGYSAIKSFQAILQFICGLQGYPPMTSGVPRRTSLKRITGHLLPSVLALSRDPFLPDIHFPHLSTGGAPLRIRLLRFEVCCFPWSR